MGQEQADVPGVDVRKHKATCLVMRSFRLQLEGYPGKRIARGLAQLVIARRCKLIRKQDYGLPKRGRHQDKKGRVRTQ